MLTSRQIIIKLIDNKIITGEEAFTLINDILQSEMLETYKALENKKNSEIFKESIPSSIPIGSIYPNTITCDNTGIVYTSGTSST